MPNVCQRSERVFFMVTLAFLGALLTFLSVAWAEDTRMEIYVPDVLSSPGKPITLLARLVDGTSVHEDGIPEKELEFLVQGLVVGQAKTQEDGWAKLEFTPKMRGNLQLVVKGTPQAKLPRIQGTGTLLSWERRRPIILVDLAVLIQGEIVPEANGVPFPVPGLMLGEPQEFAARELGKLSEFYYNLIYLDRTGKGQIDSIQRWLRTHEFPPGMIRILPDSPTALVDILGTLKAEGWENVSAGIGETADFANVLVQHRLQTVIVAKPDSSDQFPRRAIILHDWTRIRRHL